MNPRSLILLASLNAVLFAQAPPAAAGAKPPRPGAGFGPNAAAVEENGFVSIFDGQSLKGWDGDPDFWRVENGAIIGQTTKEHQPKQNTFIIWRGGSTGNFELRLEYKLTGFNSGIQYRSAELPDIKYAMKGYQADIDGEQRYSGQIYEERARGFLALRGQFTYIGDDKKKGLVGSLGDNLKDFIKGDDWNTMHIIARGNTIVQVVNGHVMSMLIDDDTAGRRMDGLLGIQCHVGPPMKIEVKNIRIKNL